MKKFVSLTFKITGFTTSVILLVSLLVALIVYVSTHSFFLKAAIKTTSDKARLVSNDIENSLINITNDILVVSKTPPIQGIVRSMQNNGEDKADNSNITLWKDRLASIFSSLLGSNPNYTQIRYLAVDGNGKELVRVDRTLKGVHRVAESALQEKGDRDYFKKDVRLSQGSMMFSSIDYNIEKGRLQLPLVPTLRVITPIYTYTPKQGIFGLLIINVNFGRYLRNVLIRSGIDYDVMIHDQYNNFFIFNHKNKTLKFMPSGEDIKHEFLGKSNIKKTSQIMPFLKQDKKRITISNAIYSNIHKDHQVLTVTISVSRSAVESKDSSLLRDILIWVIILCLLAASFIFIFTRRIMFPLTKMAQDINASISVSKEQIELPLELNDEVGVLARAFESKTNMLNQLALFDSLTGLPNRKKFIDRFDEAVQRSKRKATQVMVVFLDINKFKQVNDTYGHDAGDDLLIQFSILLQKAVREHDFCARLGGDEFGIIVEGIESNNEQLQALARFEEALNTTYIIKGMAFNVSISGGAAIYPDDALKVDVLLKIADEAMYRSKKEGLGNFHLK